MASKKKLLQAAAGSAGGGATTDITDVFSTFLYDGTGATQNINNGINLGDNIAGSVDFDGAGDSLESSSHSFAYGTGDFTVEFWMYPHSLSSQSVVFGARANSSTGFMIGPNNSGEIRFYYNNAERIVDTGNALSTNTWFHIAVTRASGTTKLFKNGTQVGSSYSDTNNYTSSVLEIGQRAISDGLAYDGLVSNVRVVLGTAVYTSNFTAPTEPLTAISGTELLICTANNFLDEGPNKIAFTVKGDPQVSSSSPFTGNTGEGGLVWIKNRDSANGHNLEDTERGAGKSIYSNTTDEQYNLTGTSGLGSFNSNGFSIIGSQNRTNTNGDSYASWTFRKAPNFFDVVTYTGDGQSSKTISHSLNTTVGMLIVKCTNTSGDWHVFHRSGGSGNGGYLNGTDAFGSTSVFPSAPTSTNFSVAVATNAGLNKNNNTYVAYLFAHNDGDGEFGPDGDQDIIKCADFTTDGSENATVTLGFEPQWILWKPTATSSNWHMFDAMRGLPVGQVDALLEPDGSGAETAGVPYISLTPTGFNVTNMGVSKHVIFMAIRRGPLAEPESATDVFEPVAYTGDGTTGRVIGSIDRADLVIAADRDNDSSLSGYGTIVYDRLRGEDLSLQTNSTSVEVVGWADAYFNLDQSGGWRTGDTSGGINYFNKSSSDYISWAWKRAPGYFDVVAYTGTGSNRTIAHNLGVAPEMMWLKERSGTFDWNVYHKDLGGADKYLHLNATDAVMTATNRFNNTNPTASVFSLGTSSALNDSGATHIAYLFATVAGVSKVGSYTGTGSDINIDCGFSNGARFVLIKNVNAAEQWFVFDSQRGISTSTSDPFLYLSITNAENPNNDIDIDPLSSGFKVASGGTQINGNGNTHIFYAIA